MTQQIDALKNTAWNTGVCPVCNTQDGPAQPQQEPVATWLGTDYEAHRQCFAQLCDLEPGTDLYTSPPASKPWVGLTEEERNNIVNAVYDDHYNRRVSDTDLEIAKAVEAKLRKLNEHKEKNA